MTTYICTTFDKRSVRLGVRTPGFHPGNRGSIPLRTTKASEIQKPFFLPFLIRAVLKQKRWLAPPSLFGLMLSNGFYSLGNLKLTLLFTFPKPSLKKIPIRIEFLYFFKRLQGFSNKVYYKKSVLLKKMQKT